MFEVVAGQARARQIDDDEGRNLLRIIRRRTGSVVTWRRAQMILLSAQGMPVAKIAEVTFTSANRVRHVIHNYSTDGFDSLYPKYKGGRPRTFTLPERREIKKIAKSEPTEHDLPFSTWSQTKLADFLVAKGVVDDISHEGLRLLLREEGSSFRRLRSAMLRQVAEGVLTHQSELLENNAVVVQGRTGVLLIDPGLTEAEMTCLADDLSELGQSVVAGFATDPDWDHVLWHPEYSEAPRYGTSRCAARMREVRSDPGWKAHVHRLHGGGLGSDGGVLRQRR